MYYWVGLQLVLRVVLFVASSLDRNVNLVAGIILFSLMQGLHGTLRPFKNDIKNYQENIYIINILILFAIVQCSQNVINMIAVNVMIGLAMTHFSLIVTHHIIIYVLSGATRKRLELQFTKLTRRITRLRRQPKIQQFELNDSMNKIPEAVNYYEFREPLVLLDHD